MPTDMSASDKIMFKYINNLAVTTVLVKCGKLRVSVFFVLKKPSKLGCNYIIQLYSAIL